MGRKLGIGLLVLLGAVAALALAQLAASESGEVVVLATRDAGGDVHRTRLWIVEDGGALWLRSGSPDGAWYRRLREHPLVEVTRGGEARGYRAVPQPEARERVNELMAAKYGWADGFIALLFGREDAVPIRLAPPDGDPAGAPESPEAAGRPVGRAGPA